jgi:hypothetical protein
LLARRDEVTAFSASETAQRRQEQERRAAEKAEAEAAKLRQEAAAAQQREREQQLTTLMDLNLQVCGYQTCLGYAWVAYCVQLLVCWCVGAAILLDVTGVHVRPVQYHRPEGIKPQDCCC